MTGAAQDAWTALSCTSFCARNLYISKRAAPRPPVVVCVHIPVVPPPCGWRSTPICLKGFTSESALAILFSYPHTHPTQPLHTHLFAASTSRFISSLSRASSCSRCRTATATEELKGI